MDGNHQKRRCRLPRSHPYRTLRTESSRSGPAWDVAYLEATLQGDLEAMNRAVLASGREVAWCERRIRENRIVAVLSAFDQRDVVTVKRLLLEVADDREQLEVLLEVLLLYTMEELEQDCE